MQVEKRNFPTSVLGPLRRVRVVTDTPVVRGHSPTLGGVSGVRGLNCGLRTGFVPVVHPGSDIVPVNVELS